MTGLAYRVQLRRPPRRRRRYRKYKLSRWATFGTGAAAPLGGWLYLGEPLHWAGLAALVLAGEVIVPVALLFLLFCAPALIMGGLVPRSWRISHRRRHGRELCKSAVITAGLRRVTFAMDRDRCLYCGITAHALAMLPARKGKDGKMVPRRLHADHYRPWIAGFLTVLFNMGLLCDEHNEIKSCYYRERRGRSKGYIWYHGGSRTLEREAMAAEITRAIRWRRWSLFRLWRAVWALGIGE